MDFDTLIAKMDSHMYAVVKQAVEIGKWPNGEALTDDHRTTCLQALIAYGERHLPEAERVGYIDRSKADGSQHGKNPLDNSLITTSKT